MHMQGEPRTMQEHPAYKDVVGEVREFLRQRIEAALQSGIARQRIVVDPGFGFGKTREHNLELLRRLREFGCLGVPIYAGLSRKSLLKALTGRSVEQRLPGSIAAAMVAVQNGARRPGARCGRDARCAWPCFKPVVLPTAPHFKACDRIPVSSRITPEKAFEPQRHRGTEKNKLLPLSAYSRKRRILLARQLIDISFFSVPLCLCGADFRITHYVQKIFRYRWRARAGSAKRRSRPDFVMHLGYAAGKVLAAGSALPGGEHPAVLIGKDTRISGYMLESALQAGLSAAGVDIYLAGPMPTPAVAYLTRALRLQAGIVICASHNPFEDNGIKFFSGDGNKLPDAAEHAIEARLDAAAGDHALGATGQGATAQRCRRPLHRILQEHLSRQASTCAG